MIRLLYRLQSTDQLECLYQPDLRRPHQRQETRNHPQNLPEISIKKAAHQSNSQS
ncbi:hypothetical protein IX327_000535 [Porphyromonas levii]|nr:hypothetical protein [Porphyromonas levii]